MNWFNSAIAATLPAVPKPLVRRMSSRYIAGETLDEALAVVSRLNAGGMMATLDVLGEFVSAPHEARRAGEEYRRLLHEIHDRGLDSNVSLKLTQMGLKLDPGLCLEVTRSVVAAAAELGNFVRLDMEDSTCTDATLDIYRGLQTEFPGVGAVIQAYLRRSEADVAALSERGANIRLCKGIYVEAEAIAFKNPLEINHSYQQLLRRLLERGCHVGIATHDERLVNAAYRLIEELAVPRDRYEFQMLLGVTESLRDRILAAGHRLRVYVPYGSHWYAYSLRRLKENPQIAGYALKGFLRGGN